MGFDVLVRFGQTTFVVEVKGSGSVSSVSQAVEQVRKAAERFDERAIPLVAVPYMGSVGREYCRDTDTSWIDLSGNAHIYAPGLRVKIEGQPNRFKRRGRPSSAFAPKSSRIARWLLLHPGESMTQREISQATDMDEGFTSRIVHRLVDDGLVVREPDGSVRTRFPDLLLDAWWEDYDFTKHDVLAGHVPARSGEHLLHWLVEALETDDLRYAVTAMGAAWWLTRYASFRTVDAYVAEYPSAEVLEALGFREGTRGANLRLMIPADEGVFHGASEDSGIQLVHPVQVYLDLKGRRERSEEAAEYLRSELLTWSANA